jgi:hypothetical protein
MKQGNEEVAIKLVERTFIVKRTDAPKSVPQVVRIVVHEQLALHEVDEH